MRLKNLLPLCLLGLAGAVAAQGLPTFEELDTDGADLVTREEAGAHPQVAAAFDEIDENGDGRIDAAEYARWTAQQNAND